MGTILIFVSFVAAFIATVSKTTRDSGKFPGNVRLGGWMLILLAAVSGYLTFEKEREDKISHDIRTSIAVQELEKSIYLLMSPAVALSDPPEIENRFAVSKTYFEAGAAAGLCDVNLSARTGRISADPIYSDKEWAVFITDRTRDGLSLMRSAQSNYGDVLGNRANILIGRIVNHPWNEFLLASERRHRLGANKILCSDTPSIKSAYLKTLKGYQALIEELESLVGRRFCTLRADHDLNDVPPVFLRSISGLIYAPNSDQAKSKMDKLCRDLPAAANDT